MRLRRISVFPILCALALCSPTCAEDAAQEEGTSPQILLLVQSSPLAGSQFYALKTLRTQIRVGDTLTLAREPDNPHDPQAVRVEWQGHKLGYVPRRENRAVATALERGDPLETRVSRLTNHPDPWKRLEFEIWMVIRESVEME